MPFFCSISVPLSDLNIPWSPELFISAIDESVIRYAEACLTILLASYCVMEIPFLLWLAVGTLWSICKFIYTGW
jgi:hypothetical protein